MKLNYDKETKNITVTYSVLEFWFETGGIILLTVMAILYGIDKFL